MCQTLLEGGRRCSSKSSYSRSSNNLKAQKQYHARLINSPKTSAKEKAKAEKSLARVEADLKRFEEAHKVLGDNITFFNMPVTKVTERVLAQLEADGLTPFVVGGSIRDKLLGLSSKDMDIEVYGGSTQDIVDSLSRLGKVDEVGKAFGVLKIRLGDEDLDISLPRKDSKVGDGHRGFDISVDPTMSPAEAALRRDYTINSMLYNNTYKAIVDPYDGRGDIKERVLRHVSDAFDEDPLRVLRGVQMASRFGMELHPDTIVKARTLKGEFKHLATERVEIEFDKLYEKGVSASKAFQVLRQTEWDENFPGLAEVNDEKLHNKLDRAQVIISREKLGGQEKTVLLSAVVASVIGGKNAEKFLQTTIVGDKPRGTARKLVSSAAPKDVTPYNMRLWAKEMQGTTISQWGQVQESLGNLNSKAVLAEAEKLGLSDGWEAGLVQGRDVLEVYPASKPGPWLGKLLAQALTEQYQGKFRTPEDSRTWLSQNISKFVEVAK